LAERAGVSVDTLRRFETTGQIAFERLVRIAVALSVSPNLDDLFPAVTVERLEDLERARHDARCARAGQAPVRNGPPRHRRARPRRWDPCPARGTPRFPPRRRLLSGPVAALALLSVADVTTVLRDLGCARDTIALLTSRCDEVAKRAQ
jgi:hypothetical protein